MTDDTYLKRLQTHGVIALGLLLISVTGQAAGDGLDASMQALNQSRSVDATCSDCPDPAPVEEEEEEIQLVDPADSLLQTVSTDRAGPEFNGREQLVEDDSQDNMGTGLILDVPATVNQVPASAAQPASPLVPAIPGVTGG